MAKQEMLTLKKIIILKGRVVLKNDSSHFNRSEIFALKKCLNDFDQPSKSRTIPKLWKASKIGFKSCLPSQILSIL